MYIHMIESLRTLTFGATAGMLFAAVLSTVPIALNARLALGAGIGAWIAAVVAIVGSGAVDTAPLLFPALFALPLTAAAIGAAYAASRSAMNAIPVPLIVALNAMRVLGVFMVLAALDGTMSGPFPYAAGIGDIVTGIFALPVARLAAKNPHDIRVLEWNVFGTLDLLVAVFLGMTTVTGGPLQLFHVGVGATAMTTLPWALIPLVLVPTYLIGHVLIWRPSVRLARNPVSLAGNELGDARM